MNVYQCIAAITSEMSKVGISKDHKNQQQGYMFRGIDAVYGALSPLLAKHQLCVLPRVMSRDVRERETKNGGALFYTVLEVEFDFVSAEDGSTHTVRMVGEAMDSGDKSSNKAMSAAYKYACFQTFCIPTEGDNDADATTHEVKSDPKAEAISRVTPALPKVDTKKVNEYSDRIKAAIAKDDLPLLSQLQAEIREGSEDFQLAVWCTFPKSIKDYINSLKKAA